ncbi:MULTISPECIES: FtsX-like permease family protein [Streptomyces]|uniref:ABC transporter permease n=1 Tax=Streptomyces sudanensis TaxID=436397 RepID=A0ABY4TBG9_9ACTN|nr:MULTISPECIES: FtsX-like permease family protein [Streptomyces]URN15568.1 ABC transporter permease [Streptomyces sudanensis]
MLAVGAAAGRRAEAGRIRFAALLCATLALSLAVAALIAAHATYQGQATRGDARTPVFQEDVPGSAAKALWSVAGDSVPGSGPFQVVFIAPLTGDAPLPPGLSAWPRAGEAALSPALRDHPAAKDITERYGRTVATIGEEGLQSPDELFAYVVPAAPLKGESVRPVTGYGPGAGPVFYTVGQTDYAQPEWVFLSMVALLGLLPAAILLTVAARTGSHARDRRTALAEVLGATPRDRGLIVVGEALLPVAVGTVLALCAVGAASFIDLRLPWTGHVLVAGDVRGRWWAFLSALLAVMILVLAVVVLSDRPGKRRTSSTRIRGRSRSLRPWALLCPLLLLVAVRGPELFPSGTAAFVMTNWVAAAGTLATLPAAVAVVTGLLGKRLAEAGRRYGLPGLIISGRRAAAHPGPMARMTAGVVVAIGLLLQVVAWQGQLGQNARAAQATVDRIGSTALVVRPRAATAEQLRTFDRALPAHVSVLSLTTTPEANRLTLRGPCAALRALRLDCAPRPSTLMGAPTDQRLRELVGWNGGIRTAVRIEQGEPLTSLDDQGGFGQTVLVSRDGRDLSAEDVKRQAYRVFPMGADVSTIGGEWPTSSRVVQLHGRWITLFGLAGIGMLATAAALAGLAEFLRNGRALAPVATLTGNRRVFWSTAALSILLPLTLAGAAGCVVGTWLAFPKTQGGASYITNDVLVSCAAVATALGIAGWIWGALVSVRQAAAWRPRGE